MPRFDVNLSILFTELPLLERPAAARAAGFDAVELWWPARAAELRDNLEVTVEIGRRLGCRAFNALYGNRVDGASPEEQDDLAVGQLALAAAAAERVGGVVLVEAVSGAPRYPLRTAADAVGVIDRVRRETGAAQPP